MHTCFYMFKTISDKKCVPTVQFFYATVHSHSTRPRQIICMARKCLWAFHVSSSLLSIKDSIERTNLNILARSSICPFDLEQKLPKNPLSFACWIRTNRRYAFNHYELKVTSKLIQRSRSCYLTRPPILILSSLII